MSLAIAQGFIEALTGSADTLMRFRCIDDDKKRKLPPQEFAGSVEQVWPTIEGLQAEGYGIFYCLNEIKLGLENFATDADVTRVRAIPADFDNGLPEIWEWHSIPDLIVHTSEGKGQALWLAPDYPLTAFKTTCRRIIAQYNSDPAVQNLSRILRLPGTLHQKATPHLVTWERGV